jgi:outer membrane lipoprotein-sorting protein
MRPAEKIERLIKKIEVKPGPQLRQEMLAAALQAQTGRGRPVEPVSIWRAIMNSRITKYAAAVIILAVLAAVASTGINKVRVDASTAVFADVLEKIQKHNYTFDLIVKDAQEANDTGTKMKGTVVEPGRFRVDIAIAVGRMSSISNLADKQTLLLFHDTKTAYLSTEPLLRGDIGAEGVISMCAQPIADLWNLSSGSEEKLGTRKIEGAAASGFKVSFEDKAFTYEIAIWAQKTGQPVLVEITPVPKAKGPRLKWVLKNFVMDAQVNEALVSFTIPRGYTLKQAGAENKTSQASTEAAKIVSVLSLWSEGKKDEAIKVLLSVDWSQTVAFGAKPHIFSMGEQEYISLSAEKQQEMLAEIMSAAKDVQRISSELVRISGEKIAAKEYASAEEYLGAGVELGSILNQEPDRMIIVQLVGNATEKKCLQTMVKMYEQQGEQEKLKAANDRISELNAQTAEIKQRVRQGQQ